MKHLELLQSQTHTMFADCIISAGEVKIGENHHLVMATKIESFLGLHTGAVDNYDGHMFFLVQSLESGEKKPLAIDEDNPEHLKLVIDAYDPEHYKATPDIDAVNRSFQHECPFDVIEGDTEIMRETEDEKHLAFINHTLALGGIH